MKILSCARKTSRNAAGLALCMLFLAGSSFQTEGAVNWTRRDSGTESWLNSAAYGNNTFVAVGDGGVIITSPDAREWTRRESGTDDNLYGVAYGNNIFVAVGEEGRLMTSSDGINWTTRAFRAPPDKHGAAYGGGLFVVVGNDGKIWVAGGDLRWDSPTWEPRDALRGVVYGSNLFVAVGLTGALLTSPDGRNWTGQNSGTRSSLLGVACGNGLFAAVGQHGTIAVSNDGTSWEGRASASAKNLSDVVFGGDMFVAVGQGVIETSRDGSSWVLRDSGVSSMLNGVAFGRNTFVAVGAFGVVVTSYVLQPLPDLRPQPPTNLRAEPGDAAVTLTWDESSSSRIAQYRLYVSAGADPAVSAGARAQADYKLLASVPSDQTEYEHSGLTNNVTYTYTARSFNELGLESKDSSNTASAVPGTDESGSGDPPPSEDMPEPEGEADDDDDDDDSDDSSSCFIAGAAYGAGSFEVGILRMFRDGFLAGNSTGRLFTNTYYRVSPAFAEVISENKALRFMARAHLTPVVRAAGLLSRR